MTQRRVYNALILLAAALMLAAMLACSGAHLSRPCYSNYPGCEETATFIRTVEAMPKGW